MLLFFFIAYFLENCPKAEMIVFENGDHINSYEFMQFLKKYGGEDGKIIKELE